MINTTPFIEKILDEKFEKMYDDKICLFGLEVDNRKNGYHTKAYGYRHILRESAIYASATLLCDNKKHRQKALKMLDVICDSQDTNPDSPTLGLWGYYVEEPPCDMYNPDYNWADFIGKWLVAVLGSCPDKLGDELYSKLKNAVRLAAYCSVKRNVKIDYTNIRVMSSFLQIAAGELSGDKVLFDHGKQALEKFVEYTRFNTAFTEYNSSTYTITAIDEISKMLALFKDTECIQFAKELNSYAWKQYSIHYNDNIKQLSPPQSRAYRNIDNGQLGEFIYIGTEGKYGLPLMGKSEVDTLVFPPKCPEELICDFEFESSRSDVHSFFKADKKYEYQGDMGKGAVTAYSYMTNEFSLGCFNCCDLWVQKRPLMAIWGMDKPTVLRLRSIHNDYDFCSGIVRAIQKDNTVLAAFGLCTDRGSFHFGLDKNKSGIFEFEKLFFRLEADGYIDELTISQKGNIITVKDRDVIVNINISDVLFDGKKIDVIVNNDNKYIDFVYYDGKNKTIDINNLGATYGVFTLAVNGDAPTAKVFKNDDFTTAKIDDETNITFPTKPTTLEQSIRR